MPAGHGSCRTLNSVPSKQRVALVFLVQRRKGANKGKEMQRVATGDVREFFEQFKQLLHQRLGDRRGMRIADFARCFYSSASASFDDLVGRRLDDVYGATLSMWQLVQSREAGRPKVRVYNPDFQEHGWQSTHTVIELIQANMPFLVDSVRSELSRRGLTVHTIFNAVLGVRRDAQGELVHLSPLDPRFPEQQESLIYVEIDRHTDAALLRELAESLTETLDEVRVATDDFEPMCAQVRQAIDEIRAGHADGVAAEDVEEACAFLEWLLDEHFTFLGFESFDLVEGEDGQQRLARVEGSELGLLKLDKPRYNEEPHDAGQLESGGGYVLIPQLISFAKSAYPSTVHRAAYPDYIITERFDADGRVIGERRFYGLYTLSVYSDSARNIPVLRRKIRAVVEAAGVDPSGHNGKHLQRILEVYPRDDLFQSSTTELCETALAILNIRERRQVRLFIREDRYGKFYSCQVYVPRDVFSTDLRVRIQDYLCESLDASFGDFTPYLSESVLARIQLILRFNHDEPPVFDVRELERHIAELARGWREELHSALVERHGEERANALMSLYRDAFPAAYRADFGPRAAVYDVDRLSELGQQPVAFSLYRLPEGRHESVRLKFYHRRRPIPLSDVVPMLENMGLRVISERPYTVDREDERFWINDFELELDDAVVPAVDFHTLRENFLDALTRIWSGSAESDTFNRLVLAAELDWREVALLRAYARYLHQIRFSLSQPYIASTLTSYPLITRGLIALFKGRFDPEHRLDDAAQAALRAEIDAQLEQVVSLNDDRLLRRYLDLFDATLRTNFFQPDAEGEPKDYISFKLEPRRIPEMPKPRPLYEIFVYSPRMEGLHLRAGRVARGGLRWSDRFEDFRTEVLGLVKAQQVKNAVIVPTGAKGGFVCKRLPVNASREVIQNEGIECYRTLIRGMLDITDNVVDKQVVPPRDVVRFDDDDPYLVVAADKGTATFSDIANALSAEYGFWLGDAFASGGRYGYDHKGMGITARGAWESVKRHFREIGLDTQTQPFTVLGVGDMAGDVFGNGMLLSEQIRLVAAFNHRHIFIDPEPDAASGFAERQRMFDARLGWDEYDPKLISAGGGVFSRDAKSIAISPEMKSRFGIVAERLSPNELIQALLASEVDLFWNGGIGTYVKASDETHAEVGDKANDQLRIDGCALRARVVGEGGNLGITQRGRREAAMHGVRLNTDFIDNAGGVNCSDHEVNIKILLDGITARGDMTAKQRNQFLAEMTDEVADLVLRDNYTQTQALSLAAIHSRESIGSYRRFIKALEDGGVLDRELEALPSDQALQERGEAGLGLTHPELSVLISYAKSDLKTQLAGSDIPDEVYIQRHVERAFPPRLVERFQDELYQHGLKHEIVATQIANDLVDRMGITFVRRLLDGSGLDQASVVRAYVIARDSFELDRLWREIEALDAKVESQVQYDMMGALMRLGQRATRWFLRSRSALGVAETIDHFSSRLARLSEEVRERLSGKEAEAWQARFEHYRAAGVPEALAARVVSLHHLYAGLGIIEAARRSGDEIERVAEAYYAIGERLELPWLTEQVDQLPVGDGWEALAREALRDDLDRQQLALTVTVQGLDDLPPTIVERLDVWLERREGKLARWHQLLDEVRAGSKISYALFAVAVRELAELGETVDAR